MAFGWLKKVAKGAAKAADVADGVLDNPIGSAVVSAIPGAGPVVRLLDAIHAAEETMIAAKGPDKAEAAHRAFVAAEALFGELGDEQRVRAAAQKVMDAYVAAQKATVAALDAAEELEQLVAELRGANK